MTKLPNSKTQQQHSVSSCLKHFIDNVKSSHRDGRKRRRPQPPQSLSSPSPDRLGEPAVPARLVRALFRSANLQVSEKPLHEARKPYGNPRRTHLTLFFSAASKSHSHLNLSNTSEYRLASLYCNPNNSIFRSANHILQLTHPHLGLLTTLLMTSAYRA